MVNRLNNLPVTPETQQQEENIIRHMVMSNGYPVRFIDKLQRKTIIKGDHTTQTNQQTQKWVTFRYYSPLIRMVTNIFKNTSLRIAFRATNSLRQILNTSKKHTNIYSNSGIYSLKCSTCNRFYIGQTGREIETRFKEHHRYIRTNNPKSAYAMHILNNDHQYGPIEDTLQLIIPCNKGTRMNCLRNLYIQQYHKLGLLMDEQNTFEHNCLFALIQS
jgi:hypothetical protein